MTKVKIVKVLSSTLIFQDFPSLVKTYASYTSSWFHCAFGLGKLVWKLKDHCVYDVQLLRVTFYVGVGLEVLDARGLINLYRGLLNINLLPVKL